MTDDAIQQINLAVKQLDVALLIDCAPENLEVSVRHQVEMMAYQLQLQLRTPTHVLQEREVCSYPEDWWQAIKARMGFKHRRRVHTLKEWLLFPKIGVPRGIEKIQFSHYAGVSSYVDDPDHADEDEA